MQQERARRVIHRGPTRVVGKFPSIKSRRMHHWESQLERDRMYHLELDPSVLWFREQPVTFEVSVNGKLHKYTPDLQVQTENRLTIEEIKPADRVPEYADLFKAVSEFLAEQGIYFNVVTDQEIRRQPYLDHIKFLMRFRHEAISYADIDKAEHLIGQGGTIQFGDYLDTFGGSSSAVPWALLAHHIVTTDLEVPISRENLVMFNGGKV